MDHLDIREHTHGDGRAAGAALVGGAVLVTLPLVGLASLLLRSRLDPHFEAPNQIKVSAKDRGSMIRIPIGNEKSARIEVRSIAPDANPYLAIYSLLHTGLEGPLDRNAGDASRERILPDNIYDAVRPFRESTLVSEIMGPEVHQKYVELKLAAADRCPRALGARIKRSEIIFHHEVTNQYLWSLF